ncbi:IgGFc-binding protein-like [Boleophthalmus pectinirostris]|uniref:IgGFc-binding protein-like n=1 Tax=Boleophthalmus pectinirostris TaxID=150288 RepID=UPI002431E20F|nr:IgGFc-binding protein-like [Boleophthalmus pectinirostris]
MTCHSHVCGSHEECKVFDGERVCYPHTCSISGVPIQLGVSVWTDSACTVKCTCTTSGLSCHNESCDISQVCGSLNDFHFTCQSIQKATCIISGDPHYTTFDGKRYDFQGPCTYVLSQQCDSDLPSYRVEGSNEHRGSSATWTRLVKVFVYNETIELVKGHRGEAKVNGIFATTPFSLTNGAVHVYTSGFSIGVSTDFGLEVSYDAHHLVNIKVPSSYQGATCGLCGNFNNDPDDDIQPPEGDIVSPLDLSHSWLVPNADESECMPCEGQDCSHCSEDERALFNNPDNCGILRDRSGPFAACHEVLSPESFVYNCVYDLCSEGGQQDILCLALNVYASQCQEKGVQLQTWRSPGFCEIICPENSHFEPQSTGCPATCVNPESHNDCALAPLESCACNEGYVLSGADCVPLHECGCNFEGLYYHSGQTVILGQDCSRICNCISGNMTCHSHVCGSHEECKVFDGERVCYPHTCSISGVPIQLGVSVWTDSACTVKCTCTTSGLSCHNESCDISQVCGSLNDFHFTCQSIQKATCIISGDPHYTTFDGKRYDFQGPCTYVLSQQCDSDLPSYRVEGSNEHRGSSATWTRLVKVFVYNETIELVKGHRGEAKVNGIFATTPFSLTNGAVHVYTSGFSIGVSTDFGLEVSYDAHHLVNIKVPSSYQGATCGLCGNFNNDPDDDIQPPEGDIVSPLDLSHSWLVPNADESECMPCEGQDCSSHCSEDERALFNNPDNCGILRDRSGPFAACHEVLSPESFVYNCVYDLCSEGGQQDILCLALNVYASQCQEKGVQLQTWRSPGFCEIICPENSHFEPQSTGCPATCVNPESHNDCALAPLESCACNEGYVLSGADCVPLHECGCNFEGLYYHSGQTVILGQDCSRICNCISGNMTCHSHVCGSHEECKVFDGERVCYPHTCSISGVPIQLGVSVWTDSACTVKCTCTTSGLSCHNESCDISQVCGSLNDFHFTCQSIQKATCIISGDPHYTTFDGKRYDFQGPCTYVLSQQCDSDLPSYRVEGSNEHRGSSATWTRLVKVFVYNETIELVKGHRGEAKVNGIFATTPFSLTNGAVHVYTSGFSIGVSTDFGLEVSYDAHHLVNIKVPSSYQGATCGLCGNFNNDPDDDIQPPEGDIVSPLDLSHSWLVPNADESECMPCEGQDCSHCSEDERALFNNPDNCGILRDRSGPFAACHEVLSPESFVYNCVYDLCSEGGQQDILCLALNVYASQCQEKGVQLQTWRSPGFCEIICPENSHFEPQSTGCPATCVNPESHNDCALAPLESCACNEGYVLSGADCVPLHECGCNFEGLYYHSGQTVILGQDCSRICNCISGNMTCHSHVCGSHEECKVFDGERGCKLKDNHGTCSGSGDPHYVSFDGRLYDFQGTCRYVLATLCNHTTGLNNFSVEVQNEAWRGLTVSVTAEVYVNVWGVDILLSRKHNGVVKVNGIWNNLPLQLYGSAVSVFARGQDTIVETDYGLHVSYGGYKVSITVPFYYSGKTCGLCGNFNGNPMDDFQTPSGLSVMSPSVFGTSWKVPGNSSCNDDCGSSCSQCPDDRAAKAQCDIIRAAEGPFRLCHLLVDPAAFFNDCVFDVCIGGAELLCSSIQVYVSSCQSSDVLIYPWRQNTSCHMVCPAHSHYELCGSDCGRTCASSIDVICEHVCSEGCFCDDGFVRSGTKCVPEENCGCQHNGFYYYAGESFWKEGCTQYCECMANNNLSCTASSCSHQEECSLRDGHLGCYGAIDPCGELQCTDNEWCGAKEGIHGCFCNENVLQNTENFDASITCVSSSGTVSLSRCLLLEAGFHPSALHLKDDSCKGSLQSGRLVFHFNNDDQLCGTILKSNGTHFIYENAILGDDSLNIQLFFSCVFPLTSAVSMDIAINPVESAIKKFLPSGQGHYRVRLIPYQDAGFQNPLSGNTNVEMHQNEQLFIEVQTEGIDEREISAVMDNCWATPINEAYYPLRQDLILQGCPAESSVKIIQNGNSTVARFSFEIFSFNNFASLYLHCQIHLCLLDVNDCVVHCHVKTRGRRDVSYHDSVILSLGPLVPKGQT